MTRHKFTPLLIALVCLALPARVQAIGQIVYAQPSVGPADAYTLSIADAYTLIGSRIEDASYAVGADLLAFSVLEMHADSVAFGPKRAHWLNYDQRAKPGGWRGRPFVVPSTCSAVRLRLREVMRESSVGATGPTSIEVWDWIGLNQLSATSCAVGASAADCVSGDIALTAGRGYQARIVANTAGTQSSFTASSFAVEPRGCSDPIFSKSFVRVDAARAAWGVTSLPGIWPLAHHPDQDALARVKLRTSASSVMVGVFENEADYIGASRATFGVTTLGRGAQAVQPSAAKALSYTSVTLPATGASVTNPIDVEVSAGMQVAGAYTTSWRTRGVYVIDIIVPASAYLQVLPPPAPVIWWEGDSKTAGSYSGDPSLDSLPGLLQRRGYETDVWALGGGTIAADVSLHDLFGRAVAGCPAATIPCAWPLAQRAAAHRPRVIMLAAGRNDTVGGASDSTVANELGAGMDAEHAANPGAVIYLLGYTKESNASEPGMDTARAAIFALLSGTSAVDGSARSTWARYLGGEGLITAAEAAVTGHATDPTADTTHPSSVGYQKIAALMAGEPYPVPSVFDAAILWLDGAYGAYGGGAGSIVRGGTSPPAFTVTGTSTVEVPGLVVEFRSGSTFDWSSDGGETWAQKGVSFNPLGDDIALPNVGVIATGWTLHLPSGSYNNLHTGTWLGPQVSAWADRSGHGHDFTRVSTGYSTLKPSALGLGGHTAVTAGGGADGLHPAVAVNLTPPYTVAMVAKQSAYALFQPYMTTAAGGYPLIYGAGASTIAINTGANQITVATATPTQQMVIIAYVNGASSSLSIGNPLVSANITTGTLGAVNLVDPTLGGAFADVSGTGTYGAFVVLGDTTSDQRVSLYFKLRDRFGTQ